MKYNIELIFERWCRVTKKWIRCRCKFRDFAAMNIYVRRFKPDPDWANDFHVVDYNFI